MDWNKCFKPGFVHIKQYTFKFILKRKLNCGCQNFTVLLNTVIMFKVLQDDILVCY